MRRLFLVAGHEFVKYVTRRGFIISIFLMPAWIVFAGVVPRWIEHNAPARAIMVVDRAGGFAAAVKEAVEAQNAADALARISSYAKANADLARLRGEAPALYALLTAPEGDKPALARFRAQGGLSGTRERLMPYLHSAAPAFRARAPRLRDLPPPPALTKAAPKDFAARAAAILSRPGAPDAILVVPKAYGTAGDGTAFYWASGPPSGDLKTFLEAALTDALRRQALHRVAPMASLDAAERLRPAAAAGPDARRIRPCADLFRSGAALCAVGAVLPAGADDLHECGLADVGRDRGEVEPHRRGDAVLRLAARIHDRKIAGRGRRFAADAVSVAHHGGARGLELCARRARTCSRHGRKPGRLLAAAASGDLFRLRAFDLCLDLPGAGLDDGLAAGCAGADRPHHDRDHGAASDHAGAAARSQWHHCDRDDLDPDLHAVLHDVPPALESAGRAGLARRRAS